MSGLSKSVNQRLSENLVRLVTEEIVIKRKQATLFTEDIQTINFQGLRRDDRTEIWYSTSGNCIMGQMGETYNPDQVFDNQKKKNKTESKS